MYRGNNPPVKNQRFLTTPFTQGSLTRTYVLTRYAGNKGLYPQMTFTGCAGNTWIPDRQDAVPLLYFSLKI